MGWTDVEVARDTDINWSTDFGATWLTDLPTDYDDVTDVRVRYGTIWTDIPVFVDPDTNSPWVTLSVHNDIVPLPADGLIALEIAGAALADLYQIGVRMDVYANDGRIIRSGEAWISTDYGRRSNVHPFGLQFIPPEDLDEILPVVPYRYIVTQDNSTGAVQLLHGDAFIFGLPTTLVSGLPFLWRLPRHHAGGGNGRRHGHHIVSCYQRQRGIQDWRHHFH